MSRYALTAKETRRKELVKIIKSGDFDKNKLSEVMIKYADCSDIILSKTERICMHNPSRNNNVCVFGCVGSRKTSSYTIPNILQCCTQNPYMPSLVINDGDGELLSMTGKALKESGYKIKVLNLLDPNNSWHFNPFHYVQNEENVTHINMLSTVIASSGGFDEEIERRVSLLLNVLIGLVCEEFEAESLYRVRKKAEEFKLLADAYSLSLLENVDIIVQARCRLWDEESYNKYSYVYYSWKQLLRSIDGDNDYFRFLFLKTEELLSIYEEPEIKTLLCDDEFSLEKISQEKTAVFVLYPREYDRYNVIANLFYTFLIEQLKHDVVHAQNTIPVRFFMEDFCSLGRIRNFKTLMRLNNISGAEIDVSITMASVRQMQVLYGINTGEIISLCDIMLCFGVRSDDIETCKVASEFGRGYYSGFGFVPDVFVHEVINLKNDELWVFIHGIDILKSKKYFCEKHKNYNLVVTPAHQSERNYTNA